MSLSKCGLLGSPGVRAYRRRSALLAAHIRRCWVYPGCPGLRVHHRS